MNMRVLVTGAAGFIGFHLTQALVARGDRVVGVDNLNAYYDPQLKAARLRMLEGKSGFEFVRLDLRDRDAVARLFAGQRFDRVAHLAAQAGVRHSLTHPHDYIDSNLVAFTNILEGCRHSKVEHLVYASSSSVYGLNQHVPFSVHHNVDHPVSLYAATKKANELMAHCYSHLYRLPTTGLRFFTVYGPWGRPDMSLFVFTRNILEGKPIELYNHGDMVRDFTYVDDIVEGTLRVLERVAQPDPQWRRDDPDPGSSSAPYRVYNIGNSSPVKLTDYVAAIEEATGRRAQVQLMPLQPGDVERTVADVTDLSRDVGFAPRTPVEEGVRRFVAWYREYYSV
jgi:UDP-glucuronate 4-epimerase